MNLKDEDLIGSIETGFSVLHCNKNELVISAFISPNSIRDQNPQRAESRLEKVMSEFIVDVQDMERAEPEGPVPAVHGAPHRLGQRHRALLRRQEHHLRQQRHHRQGLEYIVSTINPSLI